jgi:hypothetical protein
MYSAKPDRHFPQLNRAETLALGAGRAQLLLTAAGIMMIV